jgi:hypothetical protein
MEGLKTLFCSSIFAWARERISWKHGHCGHAPRKRSASTGLEEDDTSVVWPHCLDRAQKYFISISNLEPSTCVTMEIYPPGRFLLWMFLSSEMGRRHRKPTHTGRYPTGQSVQQSHVPHVSYHRDPRTAEPVRLPQTRSSASWVSSKGS